MRGAKLASNDGIADSILIQLSSAEGKHKEEAGARRKIFVKEKYGL